MSVRWSVGWRRTMTAQAKTGWNWRDEGFKYEPQRVQLSRAVTVYRVWGGTATEMGNPSRPGVCFSFEQPKKSQGGGGSISAGTYLARNRSTLYSQIRELLYPGSLRLMSEPGPGGHASVLPPPSIAGNNSDDTRLPLVRSAWRSSVLSEPSTDRR